jgi:hypothetical protein
MPANASAGVSAVADELWEAISTIQGLGLERVFEDPELRGFCKDRLKEMGCPAPISGLVVEAVAGLVAFCKEGIVSNASRRLLRIAGATPGVRILLARLIGVAKRLTDKTRLKDELIQNLKGERVPFTVPADHTTELEILKFLYENNEREELLARLDKRDGEIAGLLAEIGRKVDEQFRALYEPILDDPRALGRSLRHRERSAESLVAMVARDAFRERETDLDFLERFLGDPTATGRLHQFRWALLTGPAGEGKTRLGMHFLGLAEDRMFRVGFLPQTELKKLDPRRWQPRWATLLVIDYPAQSPTAVADLLSGFAKTACQGDQGFDFPVRVLLLERESSGEWFKKWRRRTVPATSCETSAFGKARSDWTTSSALCPGKHYSRSCGIGCPARRFRMTCSKKYWGEWTRMCARAPVVRRSRHVLCLRRPRPRRSPMH